MCRLFLVQTSKLTSLPGFEIKINFPLVLFYLNYIIYGFYGANSGEVGISKMSGAINQAILCIRTDSEKIDFIHCLLVLNKDKIVEKVKIIEAMKMLNLERLSFSYHE